MRIEERGYNMITDEQGREWLLQKLYDDGWKYYIKSVGNTAFVTTKRPVMNEGILDINSGGHVKCINNISKIMPPIERNEVLNIASELGIVDWSKVAVDTPILVSLDDKLWLCRYFADFKNGIVYTWSNGATSWSVPRREHKDAWSFAKLAEV